MKDLIVRGIYLEKGDIVIEGNQKRPRVTLRRFQEELVRILGEKPEVRYIGLEAPTGGGKTFTLLAPLLSNLIFNTNYGGAVGIYPTKPLVNDQFVSMKNMLDALGCREDELKGVDGSEIAVKYSLDLRIIDGKTGREYRDRRSVGLVRLTKETLDRLKFEEYLEQAEKTEKIERLTLLDYIRKHIMNCNYVIALAVPEYPYLLLSSLYRRAPDAQKILSLALELLDSLKRSDKIKEIIPGVKKEIQQMLRSKSTERSMFNMYSAIFSEILFLDEFHVWTMYEKPTILALVILHYLESLRSSSPENYKVIFSSATPQEEFYSLVRELGLGDVKVVRATPSLNRKGNDDRVKSEMVVRFKPVETTSWFKVEDRLPDIIREIAPEILSKGRAIVFARRSAIVELAAEEFRRIAEADGVKRAIAVVTGVKTKFPGKELLVERRETGELFVFGNYSIELGVDLKNIPYGVVYGVSVGEVIQRVGRIGRGDVDQAYIIIPVPQGYASSIEYFISRHGREVDYEKFMELLNNIMPEKTSIELLGSGIMRHKIGKLRVYMPLASYMLVITWLWEYTTELEKLYLKFIDLINKLEIPSITPWLKKVSRSTSVLVPLASFRIAVSIPYVRDGIEDYASLSTLLGNYDVEYKDGKLWIKGVSKKSLSEILWLSCPSSPRLYDVVIPSNLFMKLLGEDIGGNIVLREILMKNEIPLYVAPMDHLVKQSEKTESYQVLNAYGYAIKVKIDVAGDKGSREFYILPL